MIAYWGDYTSKRHIVHRISLTYPRYDTDTMWVTVCGKWSRNSTKIRRATLPANCDTCIRATRP